MQFTSEVTDLGVRERAFELEVAGERVPGILWTPEDASGFRPLILMGQSLGTGVAARLAAELADAGAPPEALILVSPFRSVARLFDEAVPLLPLGLAVRDRFDTEALAGRIRSEVLIVHGERDQLIPIEHGRALAQLLGPRAKLVSVPGAGHGDMWDHDQSRAAVAAFLGER